MNPFSGLSWLRRLRHGRLSRSKELDLGNMGTTFGLDAAIPSLTPLSREDLRERDATDTGQPPESRPTRPMRL